MKQACWFIIGSITLGVFSLAGCSSEQNSAASPQGSQNPQAIETMAVTSTSIVQSVDRANRTVTLSNAKGEVNTYQCGKEVINFDQIQVGDQVKATVVEQLAIFVRKAGAPGTEAASVVALAPRGAKPGVMMAQTSEVTASIIAIDPELHTVTLKGASGAAQTFHVSPKVDLSGVHDGDNVVLQYTQGLAIVVEESPQALKADAAQQAAAAEIAKTAEAFVAAYEKGDAKTVAAFWAPDGDYVDPDGRVLKGRQAIEDDFSDFFTANKNLKLRIEVGSMRFPTPNTAIEDGVTSVITPDGAPPSRTRYTNVLARKNGQWFLESVRESAFVPPNNYEQLRVLDWTIGEWADDTKEGQVGFVKFEWAPDDNFILSTRAVGVKDVLLDNGSQRIGWDPATREIRAWNFETDGGFGESTWSRDGNTWIIKSNAVLRSGSRVTATNIVTRVDPDTITWQSKDQQLDGKPLPDTQVITMKRVK
jgi:uncharacterized protein (TIGR02246 family)